jgi:hypothetical protein
MPELFTRTVERPLDSTVQCGVGTESACDDLGDLEEVSSISARMGREERRLPITMRAGSMSEVAFASASDLLSGLLNGRVRGGVSLCCQPKDDLRVRTRLPA